MKHKDIKTFKANSIFRRTLCTFVCISMTVFMFACAPSDVTVPEDFSFALTWNTYGISSYDSKTGKLIKTSHASHPEDYVTYYTLTDENKARIYKLLSSLDPESYPDEYDPGNGLSEPSMTLILTVFINGKEKTIKAEDIALSYDSNNSKGRRFLSACREIGEMLMATEEWQALPDYEFFYD